MNMLKPVLIVGGLILAVFGVQITTWLMDKRVDHWAQVEQFFRLPRAEEPSTPYVRPWANGDDPRVGITMTQARQSSWGLPRDYTTMTSGNGTTEFWHYTNGSLMFRDGVLVSLTERR